MIETPTKPGTAITHESPRDGRIELNSWAPGIAADIRGAKTMAEAEEIAIRWHRAFLNNERDRCAEILERALREMRERGGGA